MNKRHLEQFFVKNDVWREDLMEQARLKEFLEKGKKYIDSFYHFLWLISHINFHNFTAEMASCNHKHGANCLHDVMHADTLLA